MAEVRTIESLREQKRTGPAVQTHEYHFDVKMNCASCSGAIERVLRKLDGECESLTTGVESFDVSLEKQAVDVRATVPFETVLEKIKKTGKEVIDSKVVA